MELILGALVLDITKGKVRAGPGGRGNVELPRVCFVPLASCLSHVEDEGACGFLLDAGLDHLALHHPEAHQRLRGCVTINADFRPGASRAVTQRAEHANPKKCVQHCKTAATKKGFTGWKHLRHHQNASALRELIDICSEAANVMLFHFLMTEILRLVQDDDSWGEGAGAEPKWVKYFMSKEANYLAIQNIDGVELLTAEWHSGEDNTHLPFVGLTNAQESYNRKHKRNLNKVERAVRGRGIRPGELPGFREFARHQSLAWQSSMAGSERYTPGAVVRSDRQPLIPRSILHPKAAVQRYAGYPAVSHFVGYTKHVRIMKEKVEHFVLPRSVSDVQRDLQVDPRDAQVLVDMLHLKPSAHLHREAFKDAGFLVPNLNPNYPHNFRLDIDRYKSIMRKLVCVRWDPAEQDPWQNARCSCRWFRQRKLCSHHAVIRMWKGDLVADVRAPAPGRVLHAWAQCTCSCASCAMPSSALSTAVRRVSPCRVRLCSSFVSVRLHKCFRYIVFLLFSLHHAAAFVFYCLSH